MKIGILAGELPLPYFIHQFILSIANEKYKIYLYGSSSKRELIYKSSYIFTRIKSKKKIIIFLSTCILIIKFICLKNFFAFHLLLEVWNKNNNIKDFINRCNSIIPPFLDDLDIFHFQWGKSLVYYPEFIEHMNCAIVLSLRGTHINISPIVDKNINILYKKYFPQINAFHAVSKSIVEESEKYGSDKRKIKIIYPAVSSKLFQLKKNIQLKSNNKSLSIISTGRCNWIKGYTEALDAMNILNKLGLNFHYTIIANGVDNENILYQINDLGLNEKVTFINGLEHGKVLNKVAKSDLFLLPSFQEGISNSVLEAMAIGVPIISTDCGGMNEVIDNNVNGFLVPVRDSNLLAKAIKKYSLLNYKERFKIINNAKNTILKYHLLENQIKEFKNFYKNIFYDKY